MTKIFIATVQLVVAAEDEVTADDAVNNLLTECERLHDWHYLIVGKQRLAPTRDYGYTIEAAEEEKRLCLGESG